MARFGHLFDKTNMTRRAFVAWLAVFALFVQVLAPLSTAWANDAQTGGERQVICTLNGLKMVSIGQDGEPIESVDAVSCPFCVVHAAAAIFAPNAVAVTAQALPAGHDFVRPNPYTPSSIWRGAPRPSRAPPLSV